MRGLTFYVCFGRWGGVHIFTDKKTLRIVVGYVAICVLLYDIEMLLVYISHDKVAHCPWCGETLRIDWRKDVTGVDDEVSE